MHPTHRRRPPPSTAATTATASNACYRFVGPFIATIARGLHVKLADIGVAIAISELSGLGSPADRTRRRSARRAPRRHVGHDPWRRRHMLGRS